MSSVLFRLLLLRLLLLRMLKRLLVSRYLYFSEREFNELTPSCSLSQMNDNFMNKLDFARSLAGIPFVLNCAYRSPDWEYQHGRTGFSYHCSGRAVDIRCNDSEIRFKIIVSCLKAGLKVGIYKNFLHVDDRAEEIIFIGEKNID